MTVKSFMLKKFPTKGVTDCPIHISNWGIIQEYAEEILSKIKIEEDLPF